MPAKEKVSTKKVSKGKEKNVILGSGATPESSKKKDSGKVGITKNQLSVPVYSLVGKTTGNLDLPKEVFGAEVNIGLLAQAIRVYSSNQKTHFSNTKTRGEVTASTKKIYAQKGTGRARHGANSAPLFVGGGVALGPKYRKIELDLPKKMKKAALISALSQKASDGLIVGVAGLDKQTGKTKEMVNFFTILKQKSALIVSDKASNNVIRSVRNLKNIDFTSAKEVNVFEIMKHQSIVLTKEAVEKLQERFAKKI